MYVCVAFLVANVNKRLKIKPTNRNINMCVFVCLFMCLCVLVWGSCACVHDC